MTSKEIIARRPPVPVYRSGMDCPQCTASKWIIGRKSAECALCHYAVPLDARDG